MISMSHSTTKITAGNIIELSISSFGDVSIPQMIDNRIIKKKNILPNI